MTKQYGVYGVMGNFGSGKTFGTFLEISQLDKEKNFIIANVPYKFVDVFYSKAEELYTIIEGLEVWINKTNNDVLKYYLSRSENKNIVIVVDEAHLYFNARNWSKGQRKGEISLIDSLDIILTQCRKRNIKIFFISQRLKRVDINIRRMTDFVVRYKLRKIPILGMQRSTRSVYENEGDLADIQGDDSKTYVMNKDSNSFGTDIEKSKLESSRFLPLLKIFWFPVGKRMSKGQFKNFEGEAHNSFFISGLPVRSTRTSREDKELQVEEKPYTEKELKVRAWIEKNLPTFKKLLAPKKQENGQFSRPSAGCDKVSDSSTSSNSVTMTNNEFSYGLRNRDISDLPDNVNPPKRIESFRELREFEDGVSNGVALQGSPRVHIRTTRKFKRVKRV